MTPRFQARHHPKAVALVLLILLVSSCTDGTKESRGLVIASHDTAVQPPGLESAEEAFGTSIEALTTDDIFESFQAFSDGDASVALLAGPAIDIAMQSSPGAHALLPLNLSDSNDHVLLIASRGTLIEPSGENQDINADVFPQGLETRQFAFGPTDSIGTDIATFGVRQLKGTTVNRFFTQRSTQLDSAQAVISAVKNGDVEVGAVLESDYLSALAEEPGIAFSARVVWRGSATVRWVIQGDLDDRFGPGTTVKVTQLLQGDLLVVPAG